MKKVNLTVVLVFLALLLFPAQGFSSEQPDQAALAVAEHFIDLLDTGEYQLAWAQTSIINQNYTRYPEWFEKAIAVRPYLGLVLDRYLKTSSWHNTWTGLPDGDYLRISFMTSFFNKTNGLETVVLIREGDIWSVSGYYLR